MEIDYNYLSSLLTEANELRKQIKFCEIDIAGGSISYMPKKQTSFVGFKEGYSDILDRNEKAMKESDKIRSTSKNYLRFLKDKEGRLVQVDNYCNGRIDCLFQVHWFGNVRYLLPFSADGTYYPTYTYVTKYDADRVVEEYMINSGQIIYEAYSYKSAQDIDYIRIDYVPDGNYPVRGIRKGVFSLNLLTYKEQYYDDWLYHYDD